jgi:hypothetical protein
MRLEMRNHLAERSAADLLGSLHVHVFLCDGEPLRRCVVFKQLKLRRDREAFLLLFLRGDAGINDRFTDGIAGEDFW